MLPTKDPTVEQVAQFIRETKCYGFLGLRCNKCGCLSNVPILKNTTTIWCPKCMSHFTLRHPPEETMKYAQENSQYELIRKPEFGPSLEDVEVAFSMGSEDNIAFLALHKHLLSESIHSILRPDIIGEEHSCYHYQVSIDVRLVDDPTYVMRIVIGNNSKYSVNGVGAASHHGEFRSISMASRTAFKDIVDAFRSIKFREPRTIRVYDQNTRSITGYH